MYEDKLTLFCGATVSLTQLSSCLCPVFPLEADSLRGWITKLESCAAFKNIWIFFIWNWSVSKKVRFPLTINNKKLELETEKLFQLGKYFVFFTVDRQVCTFTDSRHQCNDWKRWDFPPDKIYFYQTPSWRWFVHFHDLPFWRDCWRTFTVLTSSSNCSKLRKCQTCRLAVARQACVINWTSHSTSNNGLYPSAVTKNFAW